MRSRLVAIGMLLDAEKQIYLWTPAGFTAFAGVSRLRSAPAGGSQKIAQSYSGTIIGYALYVLLIGYLLLRREDASLAVCSSAGRWGLPGRLRIPSLRTCFAFLAGGVPITSVHAEVRAGAGTRFWWFVGGAAA